jgi:hypothetical protein
MTATVAVRKFGKRTQDPLITNGAKSGARGGEFSTVEAKS